MSTATVDYAALAARSGAISSTPSPVQSQPKPNAGSPIDYNAIAAQHGDLSQTPGQSRSTRTPEEDASQTRQMLVSGLTGMPTPNMTAEDRASFEQGKEAGAVSVPLVAGAASAPAAISAGVNALAPALTRGVVGMTAWAAAHPVAAKMIWEGLKASMYGAAGVGARFAGKIINAAGDGSQ